LYRCTFAGCTNLESITLSKNLKEIGSYIFFNCTSLTEITIPGNVSVIGYHAFHSCTNLRSVFCIPTKVPKADYYTNSRDYWNAFDDNAPERKIYVPTSALDAYKEAKFWQDYADDIVDGRF
jgi:hypothetical protein